MAASNIALLTISVTAGVALSQYQAVTAAGAIASDAGNAVGFTQTGGAIGALVPITVVGTAIAIANAAVAVGAALEVDGAAGRVITKSAGIAVARALTAAAAAGDQIEVLVIAN